MSNDILEVIEYHIKNKMVITIERIEIEKEALIGFPLLVNSEILIMSKIYDFHDEGIIILNFNDITDAYSKESDSVFEQICKNEKLDKIENPFPMCKNKYDVLQKIDTEVKYVTIQCERDETELYFSIGKIVNISDENVEMQVFDKKAVWESDTQVIPLCEITLIAIDDYYSKMYYNYMNEK